MPVVPKYEGGVNTNPFPNARVSAEMPLDALGGGAAAQAVSRSVSGMSDIVARMIAMEKQKADDLNVLDKDQKLSAMETKLLYDPQSGALNQKGEQVFGMPDRVMKQYQDGVSELEKGLNNAVQKSEFQKIAATRLNDINRQVQKHFAHEKDQYDRVVTESSLINEREAAAAAYHDPARINEALDRQRVEIVKHSQRLGLPEQWTEQKMAETVSKTHMEVMSRMLANGEDLRAQAYYKMTKGEPDKSPPGLVSQGNLDIADFPQVVKPDGKIEVVESVSVPMNGKHVLIPTQRQDGTKLTKEQALAEYKKTGEHLGIFQDPASAGAYSKHLNQVQGAMIRGGLTGTDSATMEKALEEGSLRGVSQRNADAIYAKGLPRLEAMELAAQIKDPKQRDETERRVSQKYDIKKAAEQDTRNDLYLKSTNLIDSNPGRNPREVIDPVTWSNLSLEQRNALENRAKAPDANDDKTWLAYRSLSPGELAGLDQADFETKYWSKLSRPYRDKALELWTAAKNRQDDPKLTTALSFKERIDNTLRTNKLIDLNTPLTKLKSDQRRLYIQFEDAAAHELQQYEQQVLGGKRKATGDEIQKVLDHMIVKKVFVNKSWFPSLTHKSFITSDPQKPASLIDMDEKGASYVPMDKIPKDALRRLQNMIQSYGRKESTSKIERAYGAALVGDDSLVQDILKE
jgi:hypothetical protein